MSELITYSEETFESIKHCTEDGEEFWFARELQFVLEYSQWRRFSEAIERAKLACKNSGFEIEEHFADVGKSSPMPNGGYREIGNYQEARMKVMDKQLISRLKSIFDNIAHKTEEGTEFWFARELQDVLGYTEWRNFNTVIGKAKAACETTKRTIDNDFVDVNKIVSIC